MLIRPGDAAVDDDEWHRWLADGHDFGQLAVSGPPGTAPVLQPTHFCVDGEDLLIHLARPNPIWAFIAARPAVVLSVVDDHAFIPGGWRADEGAPSRDGVPTSYYAAVQFCGQAEIVDDPEGKAELLRRQLAHFQPDDDHAEVAVGRPPYGDMLSGIRGLRLHVDRVAAKFKYDDHKPLELRASIAERLDRRRSAHDAGAAREQRRRLQHGEPGGA